jgi:hypothetical protein
LKLVIRRIRLVVDQVVVIIGVFVDLVDELKVVRMLKIEQNFNRTLLVADGDRLSVP